ncbi:MAG: hypothetical protein ACLFSE_12645 [Spirochaetia bacterium]
MLNPYVFGGPEHLTHSAFVAEETAAYLRRRRNEPFFCIAGFYAPHAPLNPPERFARMYDPAEMPLPRRRKNENFQETQDDQWRITAAAYLGRMRKELVD